LGDHSLRFGGQYERQKIVSQQFGGTTPVFNFSTTANTRTPRLSAPLFPGGISATEADARRHAQIFSRRHHRRRRGFGEPDFFDFRRDYRRDSD
jgi:hypothetical protein